MPLAELPDRGVIAIEGTDRVRFLQGLVSNDVALARPGRAIWAAFLTVRGQWLADFFVFATADRLLLDCERAQIPMLRAKLGRYRLRSDVIITDASADLAAYASWDGTAAPMSSSVIAAPDPRLPDAGMRLLSPFRLDADSGFAAWDEHRLALGLPDGSRDLEGGRTLLLEAGFDALHGVAWDKGCYLGQEVTARTHYRGVIKRRLVPVTITGRVPARGTTVCKDGVACGTMGSARSQRGLVWARTDALEGPLTCGGARLSPRIPAWLAHPGEGKADPTRGVS